MAGIVYGVVPADLVLLHGFTQTSASWDGVIRELEGRYRALAPDLGAGPWEAELDRLEALAPPRVTSSATRWAGGSRSRWRCARRSGCARLVLVSASPGLADAEERAARRAADEALADRIEAIGAEAFAREWAAQPLFAGQPVEVAAAAHEDRLRRSAAEHAAQLRGLGTGVMPPLWERLGELRVPAVLIVGERDAKFRAIAERMGGSRRSSSSAQGTPCSSRRRRWSPRTWRCPEPLAAARRRSYPRRPMFRTTRTARRGLAALTWLAEWRLPAPERRAARAERAALRDAVAGARQHASTRRGGGPRRSRRSGAATAAASSCGTRSLRGVPWRFTEDVEPYAERVLPLLSQNPAEYTVALTVIDNLLAGHRFSDKPMLFGWLEEDGEVRGALSHNPPYDVLLSVVPDADELVAALRDAAVAVPGVNGDVETVERFAAAWTAGRPTARARTVFQMRLFELGTLEPPDPPPAGAARAATQADLPVAMHWFHAFTEELELPGAETESRAREQIDGGPAVAVGERRPGRAGRPQRRGGRRGPHRLGLHPARAPRPPLRRGGHGGRLADALAGDAGRVVLFTDLDNPAPNAVYQRIGFRPVSDHRVVHFER